MKRIAVICNNNKEWHHFKDSLQWNLAKQNKPYKSTVDTIVDMTEDKYYFYCPCDYNWMRDKIRGTILHDVVWMCYRDKDMESLIRSRMR